LTCARVYEKYIFMNTKLLSKSDAKKLPKIGATEGKSLEEKLLVAKIFDPCGRGTWYIVEFDGEDECFGYVVSPLGPDCDEWGYFSLAELDEVRNRMGLPLERDMWWTATKFKNLNF
jgi:hypothetical protein